MSRRIKQPTYRGLVFEALKRADDFVTAAQLVAETGIDRVHVTSALHNLRYSRAVDFIEADGALWWFATPETDQRLTTLAERAVETKPRAARKIKPKKKEP